MQSIYDFKTLTDRSSSSSKWHNMKKCDNTLAKDIVPLSTADMEFKCAPPIVEAIKEYASNTILGYSYMNDSFMDSYIQWMRKRHNYSVCQSSLVPTSGVVTSLFTAVRAFTEPSDGVMIMPPVYEPFYFAIKRSNRTIVECPLIQNKGHYEIDFHQVESYFQTDKKIKAMIFCSPHNPVGRVWTEAELKELSLLCLKYKIFVIADEIHHDIIMPGFKHSVFETIEPLMQEQIITCTSLSKTFNLAGLPLSIAVIPNENNRERFIEELGRKPDHAVSGLAYKAYETAYNKGEAWLEQAIEVISGNLHFAVDYIQNNIPSIRTYYPEGTYLLWMEFLHLRISENQLDYLLKTIGKLYLTSGSHFYKCCSNFARMNVAAPRQVIVAALERLKMAIGSIKQ